MVFKVVPLAAQEATQEATLECEADFRPVEHVYGEVCIPVNPQRVIALDTAMIELMLVLDIPQLVTSDIVIQTYTRMHPELLEDYEAATGDLPDMGLPPNFEVVLEAEPDLIIAPDDLFTRALYNNVKDTVPVVMYEVHPGAWRERLLLAGDLLNVTEEVDQLLADYDERVLELQTVLGDDTAEVEISLVRTLPGQIGLVVSGTMAQSVLASVGLSRPAAQNVDLDFVLADLGGRPEILIQQEELLLADGDIIFVFGDTSELLADPLWEALPGVQAGHAYEVGYYWWGDSLLSAHDILDDLFTYVADVEPEHPNPFEDGLPSGE